MPEEPVLCPHCGGEMRSGSALVNTGRGCVVMKLPPSCPSKECRERRDEETIRKAIAAGVIDP